MKSDKVKPENESEGMPTEPNIIKALRITAPGSGWMDVINYIDALRSRLDEALRERDAAQQGRVAEVNHWVERYNTLDDWRRQTLRRAESAERERDELKKRGD